MIGPVGMENHVKQIKVMYVFHFNGAFLGGAAQSLLDMLDGLGSRIEPVLVIGEEAQLDELLVSRGIRYYKMFLPNDVVKIGCVNDKEIEKDLYFSYKAAKKLAAIIRKEKIELMHINSSVGKVGAIAALMTQIPYIWHIRELVEEQFGMEFINMDLKRDLFYRAARLVVISDFVHEIFEQKVQLKSEKIYNGFRVERFKQNKSENQMYYPVFLAAAMISPGKGQWDAVKAVELMLKEGYENVRLILAGHGEAGYIWALKKYIKKNGLEKQVQILPYQKDLSRLRKEAFYAITCSQNEALGRVTVEAMLAGNIVIGARSGGTLEIIGRHEERGFLYQLNDSQSLAEAMIRAMRRSSADKDQLLRKAQEYAEQTFGLEQYCRKILNLYDKVFRKPWVWQRDRLLRDLEKTHSEIGNLQVYEKNTNVEQTKKAVERNTLLLRWSEMNQKGLSFETYFKARGIEKIAIYGMGELGRRLYDELENSGIRVSHILDRNPGNMKSILDFTPLDGQKMQVDMIVVTVIRAEYILRNLRDRGYEQVIDLTELLEELERLKNGTEKVFVYSTGSR